MLKKTLNLDEAANNMKLFADAKSKHALRFEDETRPHLSHYKTNFSAQVLTSPKSVRPKSAVNVSLWTRMLPALRRRGGSSLQEQDRFEEIFF